MVTLEDEFEQFKAIHKLAILKAKMIDYYETLEQGKINLPDFQRDDTPEIKANKDVMYLLLTDINKFNSLYEKAWNELAPILD